MCSLVVVLTAHSLPVAPVCLGRAGLNGVCLSCCNIPWLDYAWAAPSSGWVALRMACFYFILFTVLEARQELGKEEVVILDVAGHKPAS